MTAMSGHFDICTFPICMANKKAPKKASAKATKQQPRSEAWKRKDRTKGKQSSSWSGDGLSQQLQHLGLRIVEVEPDGNCLFRAVGDQLSGTDADHIQLRRDVVSYVQAHPNDFAAFVEDDENFDSYCKRLHEDGTWAGNIELQAASLVFTVNISVHQADQPVWTIQNFDENHKGQKVRTIRVSYHNGDHYNSVRLADDYGEGAPQQVTASGFVLARAAAAAAPPLWGSPEEQLVERGTGCNDPSAIATALTGSNGNVEKAIEALVEQMAAGAALIEPPAAASSLATAAAQECSVDGAAVAASLETQPGDLVDDQKDSTLDRAGSVDDSGHGRGKQKHQREREQKHPPRNRPCPCGRKAKYKNCCGSAARLQKKAAVSSVNVNADAAPQQLLV